MTTRPQFNPFEKGANHRIEAARITQNEKLSFEETINWLQKGVTQ